MSEENVELIRRYYRAWNGGGLDAARAFWSDDFQWHDAPGMPDAGVYRGSDAAAAHFRDLEEILGNMEVHIDGIAPAGDEFSSVCTYISVRHGVGFFSTGRYSRR